MCIRDSLGKVKNVLPGMEAAFVSFGEEKNGVLYVADIEGSTKNSKIENLGFLLNKNQ